MPPVSIYWNDRPDGFDLGVEPLATVFGRSGVTLPDPAPGKRPYFLLAPAEGKSIITAERRLPLEGEVNFRDLGGYPAADGRTVKWGQLYRSGELGRLSDPDLAYLAELDLKLVCDLRIDYEVEQLPDRLPDGAKNLWLPVPGQELPMETLHAAFDNGDFSRIDTQMLLRSNRSYVRQFTPVYAQILRRISAADGRPALIHCVAGKDRTGLGAAILLWVLGVPMETVFDDYLLSNTYRVHKNGETYGMVRQVVMDRTRLPAEGVDLAPVEALLEARCEYLQAAVDTILEDYGSIDDYIQEGLGMSPEARKTFQDDLLENA